MNDLLKKLNVLLKASLGDLLNEDGSPRRVPPERLGAAIDQEIAALRVRINEAYDYEDRLRAKVQALEAEAAQLDRQADEAVAQGRDDAARRLIETMQRTHQRLAFAQADLREHQLVAQELLTRVNALEAYVAEARRAQQAEPDEDAARDAVPAVRVADLLRSAREKLAGSPGMAAAASSEEQPIHNPKAVEDDLEQRRQRLSKR
jgi:phage shock protein A